MNENSENEEPIENKSFEELDKLANEGKLTENDMQRVLQEYAKGIREEFEIATKADPDNFTEEARNFGRTHGGAALAQIHWIMMNGKTESTRLAAAKYLIDLGKDEAVKDGDPIKQILSQLTAEKGPIPTS